MSSCVFCREMARVQQRMIGGSTKPRRSRSNLVPHCPDDDSTSAPCTHADQARWLMMIIRELRELKLDLPLVRLDEDGVTETNLNLTDELWMVAFQIDHDVAMEQFDPEGSSND